MTVDIGEITLIYLVNKAFIYEKTDVLIQSVVQYMPIISGTISNFVLKLMTIIGSMLYPTALSI